MHREFGFRFRACQRSVKRHGGCELYKAQDTHHKTKEQSADTIDDLSRHSPRHSSLFLFLVFFFLFFVFDGCKSILFLIRNQDLCLLRNFIPMGEPKKKKATKEKRKKESLMVTGGGPQVHIPACFLASLLPCFLVCLFFPLFCDNDQGKLTLLLHRLPTHT